MRFIRIHPVFITRPAVVTLYELTTGSDNTVLGWDSGRGITTGSSNTIIGANVNGLASGLSNNIIIADGAGNQRINVNSSGNVGIGTTAPLSSLSVAGNLALGALRWRREHNRRAEQRVDRERLCRDRNDKPTIHALCISGQWRISAF